MDKKRGINSVLKKSFKILAIINAFVLLSYTIFNWNDPSDHSMFISQLLLTSMLIFGGMDSLLSEDKRMRYVGIFSFVVAIYSAYVVYIKYI